MKYPRKPYRLSDDLESIVHAYRYLVLRYHLTDVTPILRSFVKTTYEEVIEVKGVLMGGWKKLAQFSCPPRSPFEVIGNDHLQSVLDALAKGCFSFYDQINLDRMQEKYGIEDDAPPILPVAENVHVTTWMQESDEAMFETAGLSLARNNPTGAQSQRSGAQLKAGSSTSRRPTDCDRDALQAEPDDPCEIHGFLSSHAGLRRVFGLYTGYPDMMDKDVDYLRIKQPAPLFMHLPRSQTSDLASKSLSATMQRSSMRASSRQSLALVTQSAGLGSPLPGSRRSSVGSESQLGKRARENASEDVDEPASKRRA